MSCVCSHKNKVVKTWNSLHKSSKFKDLFTTIVAILPSSVRVVINPKGPTYFAPFERVPTIYISSKSSIEAKIIDLSHEIGHWLSRESKTPVSLYSKDQVQVALTFWECLQDDIKRIFQQEEQIAWIAGEAFLRSLPYDFSTKFWSKYKKSKKHALASYGIY